MRRLFLRPVGGAMNKVYTVPVNRGLATMLHLTFALVLCAAVLSLVSGRVWMTLFFFAISGPLGFFAWYKLALLPARTLISLADKEMILSVPPIRGAVLHYSDIEDAFEADLGVDPGLRPIKTKVGVGLGAYRLGYFTLADGRKALVAATGNRVLCLYTREGIVMLAPEPFKEFCSTLLKKLA